MPTSFSKLTCRSIKLVFFTGNHEWAPAEWLTDGVTMLNGWYFQKSLQPVHGPADSECNRYAEALLADVAGLKTTNPGKAMMWAELLSKIRLPPELSSLVRAECTELLKNEDVIRYRQAEKALGELVERYFVVNDACRCQKRADPPASKAAAELAAEYADTPFPEILRRLAQPSA